MYCQTCGSTEHFTELCTRPKPKNSRILGAVFAMAFFIFGPAGAAEIKYTPEEAEKCKAQGGCVLVSNNWIQEQRDLADAEIAKVIEEANARIRKAYEAGAVDGQKASKKSCNSSI